MIYVFNLVQEEKNMVLCIGIDVHEIPYFHNHSYHKMKISVLVLQMDTIEVHE